LEVLEGRDLPSFGSPIASAAFQPMAMVAADINNDGNADLVLADGNGIGGYVMLGKGTGRFSAPYNWSAASGSYTTTALAVADINGDGKLDIVTADDPKDGAAYGQRAGLSVFLGKGDGTFLPGQTFDVGVSVDIPKSIAVSDVNGDGKPDVVLAGYGTGVDVAIQGPDPNFPWNVHAYSTLALATAGAPDIVAIGDVNGDSKPDILVSGGGPQVGVMLNTGSGAFGAVQLYNASGSVASLAVGDVNGDGHLDIVTANYEHSVSAIYGNGDGTFRAAQVYSVGGAPNSIALGDFNKDGKLDIVTTGTEIDVLTNNGNGTFGASQKVGPAGSNVVVTDVDGDGKADLVQIDASSTGIDVLLNTTGSSGGKGHK
jgi:hypothetical protein